MELASISVQLAAADAAMRMDRCTDRPGGMINRRQANVHANSHRKRVDVLFMGIFFRMVLGLHSTRLVKSAHGYVGSRKFPSEMICDRVWLTSPTERDQHVIHNAEQKP